MSRPPAPPYPSRRSWRQHAGADEGGLACSGASGAIAGLAAVVLALALALPGCRAPETDGEGATPAGDGPAAAAEPDDTAGTSGDTAPDSGDTPSDIGDVSRGLRINEAGAMEGYVLYRPLLSGTTYLVDRNGRVVHTWETDHEPAGGVYLLDNGHLLMSVREPDVEVFSGGGQGGRIQELAWDGEVVWDFVYASGEHLLHHDIEPLPDGNVLAIAWERKPPEEVRGAGRRPGLTPEAGLWPDMVIEIEPRPPTGGRIVWEWHSWDHLVQDHDPELPNYGDPADHPRRIDVNGDREPVEVDPEELEQLEALGYVPPDTQPEDIGSDFLHTNAVDYNADLDQIVLTTPRFHEIWIIDHGTTTEEAAGSTGGRWGHGGDLLYRWGNPRIYGRGGEDDQQLFGQHDARWIPDGLPGAGHLTIFNNDLTGPGGDYSTVLEIALPQSEPGRYILPEAEPFGPDGPVWRYEAPDRTAFHSHFISGAQRLPNGNTLICSGAKGRFFEVTSAGEIVWEYWEPFSGDIRRDEDSDRDDDPHAVFRVTKIPLDHPALAGRQLAPLDPQPETAAERAAAERGGAEREGADDPGSGS